MIEGEEEVKLGIVNAFKELLSDLSDWRASVEGLTFSQLNESEASLLEAAFTEAGVLLPLKDLNGGKALDLDNFTLAFWQQCREVFKGDLLIFFTEFHKWQRFVPSLDATFLVLISKCISVEDLKDFGPISLVTSLYKLLVKVISSILKSVMNKLVNKTQNAFVEGRQILDACLITNEIIDSIVKKRVNAFFVSLTLRKPTIASGGTTFWVFFRKWVLGRNGWSGSAGAYQPPLFLYWSMGVRLAFTTRALRQGGPLSSFLFVLGMEALSLLLDEAVG